MACPVSGVEIGGESQWISMSPDRCVIVEDMPYLIFGP
jgi:hypothetical protein